MMLKKIYQELVLIRQELLLARKELQAIRNNMESDMKITIDPKAVSQATRGNIQEALKTYRNEYHRGNQ